MMNHKYIMKLFIKILLILTFSSCDEKVKKKYIKNNTTICSKDSSISKIKIFDLYTTYKQILHKEINSIVLINQYNNVDSIIKYSNQYGRTILKVKNNQNKIKLLIVDKNRDFTTFIYFFDNSYLKSNGFYLYNNRDSSCYFINCMDYPQQYNFFHQFNTISSISNVDKLLNEKTTIHLTNLKFKFLTRYISDNKMSIKLPIYENLNKFNLTEKTTIYDLLKLYHEYYFVGEYDFEYLEIKYKYGRPKETYLWSCGFTRASSTTKR